MDEKELEAEIALENERLDRDFKPVVNKYVSAFNQCDFNTVYMLHDSKAKKTLEQNTKLNEFLISGCRKFSFDIRKIRTLREVNENKVSIRVELDVNSTSSGVKEDTGTNYNRWSFVKENNSWKISSDSFLKLVYQFNNKIN